MKSSNNLILSLVYISVGFVIGSVLVLGMDIKVSQETIQAASEACDSKEVSEYTIGYAGRVHRIKCSNGEFKNLQ